MNPAFLSRGVGQAIWHVHSATAIEAATHPAYYLPVWRRLRDPAAIHGHLLVTKITPAFLRDLGVSSLAEDLVFPGQGDHIRQRRQRDAEAILRILPEALHKIKYVGCTPGKPHLRQVIANVPIGKNVFVALKFLQASGARKDEAIVTTAYFVRPREVRRLMQRGRLRPVIGNAA